MTPVSTYPHPDPINYYPCGCLRNDINAHRDSPDEAGGPCPDFETIYPADGSIRLEDLRWVRREGR